MIIAARFSRLTTTLLLAGLAAATPGVFAAGTTHAARAAKPPASAAIAIVQPWARATAPGASIGAAYLTLVSQGRGDVLLSARSAVAARVEMHSMTMDNGEMQMRPLATLPVPAGGRQILAPGGMHLMLVDLKAPLREGNHFALQLRFRNAGVIAVDVPVLGLGAMEAPPRAAEAHGKPH